MAETNLAATWDEIRRRIAKKRGYNPDVTTWTPEQFVDVNDIIRSGYRLFLQPRPLNGPPYEWSFLKPVFQLLLPSGVLDVDLPADFGFLIGDLYYHDPNISRIIPIQRVNDGMILKMRQRAVPVVSQPQYCAIVPNRAPGTTKGQRSILMLWPTPNMDYNVQGRYSLLPEALDISHPYPYGGGAHAETLIQACLAASEEFNDTPGSAAQHYATCLASSIEYDRRVASQMIMNEDGRWSRFGKRGHPGVDSDGINRWSLPSTYNGVYSS